MKREIVPVQCQQCAGVFRCIKGSVAYREQLCNLCFGITDTCEHRAQMNLGWPE